MTKFNCTLTHPTHGSLTTVVDHSTKDGLYFWYAEIAEAARRNLASRFVDYESFGSDSAYADRLDVVGAEFMPVMFTLETDQPRKRFSVLGQYSSDEQGTWSDHVEAVDREEAEFIARQIMADNERTNRADDTDFSTTLEEIDILECDEEPVTKDEALALLAEYGKLHDGLSDMIESGRVTRADLPNDYEWLADKLAALAPMIDKIADALKPQPAKA